MTTLNKALCEKTDSIRKNLGALFDKEDKYLQIVAFFRAEGIDVGDKQELTEALYKTLDVACQGLIIRKENLDRSINRLYDDSKPQERTWLDWVRRRGNDGYSPSDNLATQTMSYAISAKSGGGAFRDRVPFLHDFLEKSGDDTMQAVSAALSTVAAGSNHPRVKEAASRAASRCTDVVSCANSLNSFCDVIAKGPEPEISSEVATALELLSFVCTRHRLRAE